MRVGAVLVVIDVLQTKTLKKKKECKKDIDEWVVRRSTKKEKKKNAGEGKDRGERKKVQATKQNKEWRERLYGNAERERNKKEKERLACSIPWSVHAAIQHAPAGQFCFSNAHLLLCQISSRQSFLTS